MAPLLFICPKTNQQAPSGIETDVRSLSASWKAILKVNCSCCGEVHTTTAPPWPCSRRGRIPRHARAWNGHSTALFMDECQSFLDNVIAGFGRN